ncbi:MAG: DUF3775 domain-containing protein [Polymorphobacter sp.]
MEFNVPLEMVCRIILRAREFDALVPDTDPDEGSNPVDDGAVDELEDDGNNPVEAELRSAIDDLADDERAELVALALIGRGSYDASEWADALQAAEDDGRTAADFLLSLPLLGDYLEDGLAAFDLSCDGIGQLV